jgi:hypothetical protein
VRRRGRRGIGLSGVFAEIEDPWGPHSFICGEYFKAILKAEKTASTLPCEPLVGMLASNSIRRTAVPKYVIERDVPGAGNLTDAQLRELSQKSVNVLKGMGPEIQWLHSYVTGDKVYCVYLAPDEATIKEHAKRVGLPANRVSAVRRLLDASSAE